MDVDWQSIVIPSSVNQVLMNLPLVKGLFDTNCVMICQLMKEDSWCEWLSDRSYEMKSYVNPRLSVHNLHLLLSLFHRSNARILQEVNKIMNQSWDNFLSLSFMDDSLTICNIIPLIWIVIIFSLITNRPLSLVNISSFFSLFLYRKVVCCWVPLDTNRLSILNEREEILR